MFSKESLLYGLQNRPTHLAKLISSHLDYSIASCLVPYFQSLPLPAHPPIPSFPDPHPPPCCYLSISSVLWCPTIYSFTFAEGNGTPLQFSCLENPMDGGAWWAAVHGVAKSPRLSDFTFPFHFHALEKAMATHSNALAWRIPGTGEPGGLPSMGSHRVGHDGSDLAAATGFTFSTWTAPTV